MSHRDGGLSVDDLLEAVGHPQRRDLLLELLERTTQDGPTPTIEVSAQHARSDGRQSTVDRAQLSRLEACGIVDWNETSHEVTPGPNFGQAEPLLHLAKDDVIDWDDTGEEVRRGSNFDDLEPVIDLVT
ncbi:hypothetical protein HWV07_15255 [Natronomonas salina]|uniref:hypothetical protein n=1 Tax=Natronomonas salina TaxID=1710540 RepID=UPI0015B6D7AD|nr:hypothetical protein [Natronomonas salina]QLD90319.1 hypothetical protein HWV07_15255 [Natronomonas salina]